AAGLVVDVGSGAGLPGLVLACARPDLELRLVEARRRRASFLREAIRTIPLAHARVLEARAEAVADAEVIGRAAVVIARAVRVDAFLPLAARLGASEGTVYEVLVEGRPASELIRPTAIERLHVLPATRDLVGAEVELIGVKSREHRLHEGLAVVRSRYELILIDCPPSLNLLTVNALRTADTVLIPLQCEYYALEGLTALLDTVGRVRDTLHPGLALEGLV